MLNHRTGAALLAVCACTQPSGHTLRVDLLTDLAPGLELDHAVAVLDEGPSQEVWLDASRSFGEGGQLMRFEGVRKGTHALELRLELGRVEVVVQRLVFYVSSDFAVTAVIDRRCRGVMCPADDPSAIACLGGRCVTPECAAGDLSLCPEPECAADAECLEPLACSQGSCVRATCLYPPQEDRCAPGSSCVPGVGCQSFAPVDGGSDAGPLMADVGTDAVDAGVDATECLSTCPGIGCPCMRCGVCDYTCSASDCGETESDMSSRTAQCLDGASCRLSYSSINRVLVSCQGSDCDVTCNGVNRCDLSCDSGSSCRLSCAPAGCRLQCTTTPETCADGSQVCGRECPSSTIRG